MTERQLERTSQQIDESWAIDQTSSMIQQAHRNLQFKTSLTTHLASIAILPLSTTDLNEQCEICSRNIRGCVKAAWAASHVEYLFSQTKLRPIQKILDECRLRLDIWMSDCGISEEALTSITGYAFLPNANYSTSSLCDAYSSRLNTKILQ